VPEPAVSARSGEPLHRPILAIGNIDVVYDRVILVLKGVSLEVQPGAITALLGANGAGKSTTLKAISGVLASERGTVTKGAITLDGQRIEGKRAFDVTRLGVAQVFEGRRIFEHLTCEENLIAGGHLARSAGSVRDGIERAFHYFPHLKQRRRQLAGYLSGGEQQMLAIGRALMSRPRLVLLDEPSLGLAPMLVEEIFGIVAGLVAQEHLAVLLVEQNAAATLAIAQHGYVMENGRIVLEGAAAALRENPDVKEFYLGLNEVGARKSYRETKHYRRRKRWLS
jgi:branched-chain amino acid transport system ATP-binding protein